MTETWLEPGQPLSLIALASRSAAVPSHHLSIVRSSSTRPSPTQHIGVHTHMAARCTLLKQQQQLNSSLYQHITAPAPLTSTRACLQIKRPHARIRIKRPALFLSLATGMAGWLGKRTQPQPAQHLCACGTRLVCLAALGREPNVRSECALEAGPTKAVCHAVYSACHVTMRAAAIGLLPFHRWRRVRQPTVTGQSTLKRMSPARRPASSHCCPLHRPRLCAQL